MKMVDVGSHQIHTLDQGTGPPVVLLHGFPLDHSMWRYQIEALATEYRVIAPDLRGFGNSPIEPSASAAGVTMEVHVDDVAGLLDGLGVAEPVVLCGFSMGGYIAMQFVRRHGDRLRGLVLMDTKAASDAPQVVETRLKMAENVEGWGAAHVARLMTSKMYAANTVTSKPEIVAEFEAIVSRTDPVAIAAAQRGMAARQESETLLPTLGLPVLYIVGAEDQISPPAEMRAMAEATPVSSYIEIANAGHMSPMENPTEVNTSLLNFLAGIDA